MKSTLYLFTISLICIFPITIHNLSSQTSADNGIQIRIAKYKGDRKCAISYTFDDGLKEHYTIAAPQLEKRNFRGTFWICGAKTNEAENKDTTRASWTELKEMANRGHEISNHGWSHKRLTRLGIEEIRSEIFKNDSAIFKNVGIRPVTFCYPYNAKSEEVLEIASMNRVSTRTQQIAIGNKSTEEKLNTWVNSLLKDGEWGIGMTHGITYGYDSFNDPSVFWNHLDKIKSMEDSIWVGTFREIAAYIKERVHLELKVDKLNNGNTTITPQLKLDKNLFTEPLTLVIEKDGISKITITQDKKRITVNMHPNKVIFDFDPHGGPIQIVL